MKKGLDFLDQKGLEYEFCDIKKLDESTLNLWLRQKSLSELVNSTGMSARKFGLNKDKINSLSEAGLKELVLQTPSLIKRPVIEKDGKIFVGKEYEQI